MHTKALLLWSCLLALSTAACPFSGDEAPRPLERRQDSSTSTLAQSDEFLDQFKVDDSKDFLTSDVGGPIEDQVSLKVGNRGPSLLEDFIFRQKIQHFDHERVCSDNPETETRVR